jgi:hypothetical protein
MHLPYTQDLFNFIAIELNALNDFNFTLNNSLPDLRNSINCAQELWNQTHCPFTLNNALSVAPIYSYMDFLQIQAHQNTPKPIRVTRNFLIPRIIHATCSLFAATYIFVTRQNEFMVDRHGQELEFTLKIAVNPIVNPIDIRLINYCVILIRHVFGGIGNAVDCAHNRNNNLSALISSVKMDLTDSS